MDLNNYLWKLKGGDKLSPPLYIFFCFNFNFSKKDQDQPLQDTDPMFPRLRW